jgi:hypothetical protein
VQPPHDDYVLYVHFASIIVLQLAALSVHIKDASDDLLSQWHCCLCCSESLCSDAAGCFVVASSGPPLLLLLLLLAGLAAGGIRA